MIHKHISNIYLISYLTYISKKHDKKFNSSLTFKFKCIRFIKIIFKNNIILNII